MDSQNRESHTPQAQGATGDHRDMMFCHECRDEWYRHEHGLTCPECGSDFTEIIEENNDPRDNDISGHVQEGDDGEDDSDLDVASMPELEPMGHHQHPLAHHNPWRDNDDPEEADISNWQMRPLGPHGFAVTATMHRTISPADYAPRGNGPNTVGGFASFLNSLIGGSQEAHQDQQNQNRAGHGMQGQGMPASGFGTTPGGHRFSYTAGARVVPRDSDHPGPHMEPVDELNNVLAGLMAAFGEPPAHQRFHGEPGDMPRGPPLNPIMALFGQMMAGNGQAGDAVYSQEALDRIISQLMEQNTSSNAPAPASQDDINSLPRKHVTVDMLGPEGTAECSICMEEVNIGEEVAELPCHHWFHHGCVAMWLGEHNTCPHCRKGITKDGDSNANQNQSSNNQSNNGAPSNPPSRTMPGSFNAGDVVGDGSARNPYVVAGSAEEDRINHQTRSGSADDTGAGGGFGERLRRGLFGPPQ